MTGSSFLNLDIAFILGSGFSKAYDERMPLTSELGRNIDSDSRHLITSSGYQNFLGDLETLFSLCFNDYPWLQYEEIHRLRAIYYRLNDLIAKEIRSSLTQLDFTIVPAGFKKLIDFWNERSSQIITFNYDTIVESLLGGAARRDWNDFWKLPIRSIGHRFSGTILGGGPPPKDAPTLIKLHGSIDWWHSGDFSDRNEEVFYGATNPNTTGTADLKPLLIPPTVEKTQFYQHKLNRLLWRRARAALQTAKVIVIMGYSMPPSDSPVRMLLQTTLPGKDVYIVNSSSDDYFRTGLTTFFSSLGCRMNWDYSGKMDAVNLFGTEIDRIGSMSYL